MVKLNFQIMDSEAKTSTSAAYLELLILAATALFLELLIIRWMSADIRAFIVFRTFPLVSCFVGFGTGFALGRDSLFKFSPIALLVFVCLMKGSEAVGLDFWQFPATSVFQWQNLSVGNNSILYLAEFILFLTVMLSSSFFLCLSISSRIGVIFNRLNPLKAYAVDLAGSFMGSVIFALFCYLELAPWTLACLAQVPLLAFLLLQHKIRATQIVCTIMLPFVAMCTPPQAAIPLASNLLQYQSLSSTTYWSPYQRLDVNLFELPNGGSKFLGLELCTNRAFYQYYLNDQISSSELPVDLRGIFADRRELYALPFKLGKSDDVLVVGAGTGQNVAPALEAGAKTVDAVDIDPVILRLGEKYNPLYSDPRVNLICDDARHYFNHCKKKYDLIIFTMLDSQAVVGSGSSVRLDAYVYTKESFQKAQSLLKPDGHAAVAFAIFQPWLEERFVKVLTESTGSPPLNIFKANSQQWKPVRYFIFGSRHSELKNANSFYLPGGWQIRNTRASPDVPTLTDDWPYLYVRPEIIDYPYLLVVAEIVLISLVLGKKVLFKNNHWRDWQLFFLGAGFLLLELHAISFLSLIYGSTWLTSAIVINSILVLIAIANLIVLKMQRLLIAMQSYAYVFLFVAIALSYFFPSEQLLENGQSQLAIATVSVITILPMFAAGLIFPAALAQHRNAARALGFNLFGSLFGGLLEYLSNYLGIRSLEIVGGLLYLTSWISFLNAQKQSEPTSLEVSVPSH